MIRTRYLTYIFDSLVFHVDKKRAFVVSMLLQALNERCRDYDAEEPEWSYK
jgi:hypothetical protein